MAAKSPEVNARLVRDRYTAGLKPIQSDLQEYWLNHSFLIGNQWIWYNPQTKRLDDLPRDPDRVQATMNRMWPNSRTIISKSLQRELTFEVIPSAADDATTHGAKLAESIVESTRIDHGWEAKREGLHWAAWKGGTAAICVDWDPNGGLPALPAETPEDVPTNGGDTVESVLSIADFVVEPGVRDAEKARWWVKAQVLPPAEVQSIYDLPKEPEADATAGSTPFQRKLLAAHTGGSSDVLADLTLVLTYYERPNHHRPEGAMAVVVGEKVVGGGVRPWPFPWKDHLNLAVVHETPNETKWTGETVLSMARPIQVAFNASWSSIIEHMKQAGNARLFVPQSTIDLIESMTDMPGEFVPYPDGVEKPAWGTPPSMPQWWIDEPERLAVLMDDVMGSHDISRGVAPTNAPDSGYGLSILAEQDTTPVGKLVKSVALAFGKVASMCLELFQAEVHDQRTAIVRTPSQAPETSAWTGKDILRQTQAEVPIEAVLPRSHAAMAALAEKMITMKLIGSFEEFATVAEVPGYRDLINRLSPDLAKARWENHAMATGDITIPDDFDDHAKHITAHNDFRKSPKYRMLPQERKDIFTQHILGHETLAAQQMGDARARAAVDPVLASAPKANGGAIIPVDQLPPGGGTPAGVVPADAGAGPDAAPPDSVPPAA